MVGRCSDPKNKDYDNYGGRGILVVPPLDIFRVYKAYVEGLPKPPNFEFTSKFHLDRINNDLCYMIGNLRWVTVKSNLENSRNVKNNPKLKKGKKLV